MREINLPSGATLKIQVAPFSASKALYKAVLKELKGINIDPKGDATSLYKDIFCTSFSSEEIEKTLWECLKRCTLNSGAGDLKIDDQTFEPVERRDDYMKVCIEVAKDNILPFAKSLYAEYQHMSAILETPQT